VAVGQKGLTSVPFQGNVSSIIPKSGHKPEKGRYQSTVSYIVRPLSLYLNNLYIGTEQAFAVDEQ
jgi:hypothetical protein